MSEITKRAFASSLKKMLAKRPLEKIRVIDITEDCGKPSDFLLSF